MSVVKTPQELLSAVPFLLGFHPESSIVAVSVKDDALEMAMRLDYPTEHIEKLAELLASHLKKNGAQGALVIAYAPENPTIDPTELLNSIGEAVINLEIPVREIMLVQGGKWRSIMCQDETCCPVTGNDLPEFSENRITAEQVAQGKILPFADSEALANSIASNDLSTDEEYIKIVQSVDELTQVQKADILQEYAQLVSNGYDLQIDTEMKAKVTSAVKDVQVRDLALGAFTNPEFAKYALITLAKSAPIGYVAPVASLAGAYAYEMGEGALAHRLLDKALADDANYSLASLLRRVFSSGFPVEGFAQLRAELHGKVLENIYGSVNTK